MQALHLFQKALQCPMQGTWKPFVWGISFLILLSHWAKAQDKYERFLDNGKYGIKKNGKKHVKAKYGDMKLEDKSDFVLIRDYKKSKWGVMDKISGKEIIPLRYDEIVSYKYVNPFFKAKINDKFGIVDQNGKEVIPVTYNNIFVNFSENEKPYFIVEIDEKYGILDINNKEILPIKYNSIQHYSTKNLFKVVLNKKMGIVDMNNKEIFPIKYDYFIELPNQDNNGNLQNTDMYIVTLDGKYGIVDKKDKEILPIKYEYMGSKINEGKLIAARMNKRWGFLEIPSGKVIIPFNYVIVSIFDEDNYHTPPNFSIVKGKSVLKVKDLETKETVFFDIYGNRVDERGEPLRVEIAKNVFLHTKKGETLVGLEDKDGNIILKPTYSQIIKAEKNFAIVSLNNKRGVIDATGKVIVPCQYDDVFFGDIDDKTIKSSKKNDEDDDIVKRGKTSRNYITVLLNGKYGTYDKNGKQQVAPKYDFLGRYDEESGLTITNIGGKAYKSNNYISSIVEGKFGFIDKNGREVLPCKYNYLSYFYKREFTAVNIGGKYNPLKDRVEGGKWGMIDKNLKEVIPVEYDERIEDFDYIYDPDTGKPYYFNEIRAKKNGKWGVIDKQNNVIIPFEYQNIGKHFANGLIAVSNDGFNWGFVDKTGKLVIPIKFRSLDNKPPYFFRDKTTVLLDNEPVYIDKSGNVLGIDEFEKKIMREKYNRTSYKEDTTPNNSFSQKNNKDEKNSNTVNSEKKVKRTKWKCDGCGEIVIMEGSGRPQANKSRCPNPKVKNSTYHSWDYQSEVK